MTWRNVSYALTTTILACVPGRAPAQSYTPALTRICLNESSYPTSWPDWDLMAPQAMVTLDNSENDHPITRADEVFGILRDGWLDPPHIPVDKRCVYIRNFGIPNYGDATSFLALSAGEPGALALPGPVDPQFTNPSTDKDYWCPRHPWFTKPLADDLDDWNYGTVQKSAKKWMRIFLARLKADIDDYNATNPTDPLPYPNRWLFDTFPEFAKTWQNLHDQMVTIWLVANDPRWLTQNVPGFGATLSTLYNEAVSAGTHPYSPSRASQAFCPGNPTADSTTGIHASSLTDKPFEPPEPTLLPLVRQYHKPGRRSRLPHRGRRPDHRHLPRIQGRPLRRHRCRRPRR